MTFHKGIVGVRSAIACIIIVASPCCVPGHVLAQQAYPMLMSIEPVAAQVGQTTEHTLKSRYSMDGAYRVLVSGEGVTGEVVPHTGSEPPKLPQQSLQVKFTVAPDSLPGVRDVRIATPRGVSTVAQLVIAHDPIFKEPADNDLPSPPRRSPFQQPSVAGSKRRRMSTSTSFRQRVVSRFVSSFVA